MMRFFALNKNEGEKVIMLLRRHWFVLTNKLAFWLFVAILPLILFWLTTNFYLEIEKSYIMDVIIILSASIFYLYVWLFIFNTFADYYLDVWIVTTERIINIEQKGLFSRQTSEQKLYRIQDITSEIKGIFPTLLDYGTVYIQTAGEQPRFIFKQVPAPQQVAKKIIKIIEQNKKYHQLLEEKEQINAHK